jgi:hypothetical protein
MLTRREVMMLTGAAALTGQRAYAAIERPLVVSMMTCPRPHGASYLDASADAVDAELADRPRLLLCDTVEVLRAGWTSAVMPPREKIENKRLAWPAFSVALSYDADLLFLEDDIKPIRPGAFKEMARHKVAEGCAFASFYHRGRAPGVYDAGIFDMSQAVLIPAVTVRALWAARDRLPRFVPFVDLAIADVGRHLGWKFEQAPPLVAHVGAVSAAMPGRRWD